MRGLSFEIPNKYGQYLFDILNAFDFKQYVWKTGGQEAYYIENDELGTPLFQESYVYTGEELYKTISKRDYYVIFADLKAFPAPLHVKNITTYEEFLNSRCEFVLLLVDCSYVTIYAKNPEVITAVYAKVINLEYQNVAFITAENDSNTTLIAF